MTHTEDLIFRLRDTASRGVSSWGDLQQEAADELETLMNAVAVEREACAISVFTTRLLSGEPDADDKGVYGWLQEAEEQIRARGAKHD